MKNNLFRSSLQTSRYVDTGSLQIPHTAIIEWKNAHDEKVMDWVGFVNGQILQVCLVPGIVKFDLMIRARYNASWNVTDECLDFLMQNFTGE